MLTEHIFEPISREFIRINLDFIKLDPIIWEKYSVMIMLGIFIAIILGIREGKKIGILPDEILDGVLIVVPLSIIGARLWYVIFEWENYAWDIIKIIDITKGGLAIHGGFFVAFISVYFYTKKKNISILGAFDLVAPGFLIAQAMGRWGNFFNQEAHGGVIGGTLNSQELLTLDQQRSFLTDTLHLPDFITNNMYLLGPDGMNYYHPTFLYESIWNLAGFAIMLILRRTKLIRQGDLLVVYLIWYSIGRFFIEGMRTDSLYIGNTGLRTAQIISLLMIVGGVVFAVLIRKVFKSPMYSMVLDKVAKQNIEQIK